jgi:RimJ/RimL family protein N-acetyltransferase
MADVVIREIRRDDAEKLLKLSQQVDNETKFLMLEPNERESTPAETETRIQAILDKENTALLVAENSDAELVGFLFADGGDFLRIKHRLYMGIAILQAYTGRGIGKQLFEAMEIWARAQGIHRIELTVMSHNEIAIGLYKKMGYQIEGRRVHSMLIDGQYVDEFYMGKLL